MTIYKNLIQEHYSDWNTGENYRREIIKAPEHYIVTLYELVAFIKLPSLEEVDLYVSDPLLTEQQRKAVFWANAITGPHIVVTAWMGPSMWESIRLCDFHLFNRIPYYVDDWLRKFTGLEALVLEPGMGIYLSHESAGWGGMTGDDRISLCGQYTLQAMTEPLAATVNAATISTLLAPANSGRAGLTVFNQSESRLYLEMGYSVSLESYAVRLEPNGLWEAPAGYTGAVYGIWESADGHALIREFQ